VLSYRLIQHNSAEDRICFKQARKLQLAAKVTGDSKLHRESTRKMTLEELVKHKFFQYVKANSSDCFLI